MKLLVIKLIFILAFGDPETSALALPNSATDGNINIAKLEQIEDLIRKKAGAEIEKNHENSFELNGYSVYTEVTVRNYGQSIYEEAFFEVDHPEKEFRMRLTVNENGERELAVMVHDEKGNVSYHACFDEFGIMFDEDPWGDVGGYTIDVFDLYKKYRNIYSQRVDAK